MISENIVCHVPNMNIKLAGAVAVNYIFVIISSYFVIFKTVRCGSGAVAFIFSIYLNPVLYHTTSLAFELNWNSVSLMSKSESFRSS